MTLYKNNSMFSAIFTKGNYSFDILFSYLFNRSSLKNKRKECALNIVQDN